MPYVMDFDGWVKKHGRQINGFYQFSPKKPLFLVGIYNQQFQRTIILMVFDSQGLMDDMG